MHSPASPGVEGVRVTQHRNDRRPVVSRLVDIDADSLELLLGHDADRGDGGVVGGIQVDHRLSSVVRQLHQLPRPVLVVDVVELASSVSLERGVAIKGGRAQRPQPDRAECLSKICGLLKPGGYGVISYDERFGSLFEVTKQLILKRACQLKGINSILTPSATSTTIKPETAAKPNV